MRSIPLDVHPNKIVIDIFVLDRLHVEYTLAELELAMLSGAGRRFDPMIQRIGELLSGVSG